MADPIRGQTAVCGLGITEMGKVYGHDSSWFAGEAIRLAVEDAGISKDDLDGLLINPGITGGMGSGISIPLQNYLGLRNLRLLNHMNSFGATASAMIQYAAMAVHHGMANYVACVFADAPPAEGRIGRRSLRRRGTARPLRHGQPDARLRLLRRQHFLRLGGAALHGAIRRHQRPISAASPSPSASGRGTMNPHATMRDPITLEDYHNSRWIVEPFHLLDCCLVLQRRSRHHRHHRRTRQRPPVRPRLHLGHGPGPPRQPAPRRCRNRHHLRRRDRRRNRLQHGWHRAARRGRLRVL